MIDAGPLIHYQHYKSLNQLLTGTGPVLLLFLGIQTVFVTVGVGKRLPSISAWIGSTFKTWQLLGVGLIFVVSSAALSRDLSAYFTELFIATFVQLVNLGNILLMVWAIPREALGGIKRGVEQFFGRAEDQDRGSRIEHHESKIQNRNEIRGSVDRFAIVAAIWIFALAALLNYFVYQRHPHIPDEIIYLYHARYFAAGWLTVPAPPVPEAFSLYMIPERSANWYSIFPPGWPAILAVGVLLGVPWMVNPLLAGVNVLLSYIFVQELYDRRVARIVVLLLCVSPWHVFMSMNFMAHTFTLTCALAGSLAMARAKRSGKTSWGLAAGLATGVASLIRPLDGFIVGILLGAWAIGLVGSRLKALPFAAFLFGAGIVSALTLPYNRLLTGDAFVFPLTAYYEEYFGPKTNAFGFGPERGLGWALDAFPGHTPLEAVLNALLNIFSVNIELFGWSIGSLLACALILGSGRIQKNDYSMVGAIVAVVGFYSFYWFNGGPDFGARYWYLTLLPFLILTARGIQYLEQTLKSNSIRRVDSDPLVMVAVCSMCLLTLVNYIPWRAVDKYYHYLGMRPDIRYLAKEYGFGKSLVLIRGNSYPDYASAWAYNPLDAHADDPVYAWDRSPEVRKQVINAYTGRTVWFVDGPTLTGNGFSVVQGLLSEEKSFIQNGR
jgi:hypothetical protein